MRGWWLLPWFVACDLGAVPGIGPDAGPRADAGPCLPAATPPSGHHMPNTSCISGGCHADASGGVFTIAGTLNTTAAGGTPVTGATITITGNDGLVHSMVSGDNGNFFYAAPVAFPATVSVSRCPDVSAMPGTITATGGNCTSCHTSGGAGGGRVHLP